jgi:hypothetical protein
MKFQIQALINGHWRNFGESRNRREARMYADRAASMYGAGRVREGRRETYRNSQ